MAGLQKTVYQNNLEKASEIFPLLNKTPNHLSEVSPVIIAKEKPKHSKSLGGNSLSRRVEKEVDSIFSPRQHLAQNGSNAASVSNSPALRKPSRMEERLGKGCRALSAPAAVPRRCRLARQMNEAAQLRIREGPSGLRLKAVRAVYLSNHACCCATHSRASSWLWSSARV